MGSTFGEIFKVTTFGESHGPAIGCVIDGCPAGLALTPADISKEMERRRPGYSAYASKRREADEVEILSGIFNGLTTGTPICLMIYNRNQNSADYDALADVFRPGHGDYTYFAKYGLRDYRGGGRASARETAARVAAGAVAKKILSELCVAVDADVASIGDIGVRGDFTKDLQIVALLEDCIAKGDSVGSTAICRINGLKPGIGQPVFDKLSADLAKAVCSIGGVKAIEFGAGFGGSLMRGSENNDNFTMVGDKITKASNNAGGILGGISDGDEILFKIAFKPPPSIAMIQHTVDKNGKNVEIAIGGRHDPVIAPRACVVIEAMAAMVVADHIFRSLTDKMQNVKKAYFDI